ncbi:hypothetical protein BDV18DRAFT_162985 [Aspergillus unguis]
MPHFHHKRRHSWPYCGSGNRLRGRNLPIITVTEAPDELEGQFLAPIVSEDLFGDDDAASAGIIRSETRPHRVWSYSKRGEHHGQIKAGTVSLRKMMQPPLDRARSLFILPTTVSARETASVPYWIQRLSAHPIRTNTTKQSGKSREDERGRLMIEKNHRRCHSERPRAWKQPSEKLWTLKEESS